MPSEFEIATISTPELGDRSYVLMIDDRAAVIDPQRDIDRVIALLDKHRVTLDLVLETHIHNDYVTGGYALANEMGAVYAVSGRDDVSFARRAVGAGDRLDLGSAAVWVLDTPGHTPNHLAYVFANGETPLAVFTGGSLLYGTVGRTDLITPELTEPLTRSQYRSVVGLLRDLDGEVPVYPTHGFGSFCASGESSNATASTIAIERTSNLAATAIDEDAFVATVMSGLGPYPSYYSHMAPLNRGGPPALQLEDLPRPTPTELTERVEAGQWVIDVRDRREFAAAHLPGTLSYELLDSMATYLGWTKPWKAPLTILGAEQSQVDAARVTLGRIGIAAEAAAADDIEALGDRFSSYAVATWDDVAASAPPTILDTRQEDEFDEGHLEGALNIPLQDTLARMNELPGGEVWVHCRTGHRAGIVASMLDRAGREVVLIDDDISRARSAGLTLMRS